MNTLLNHFEINTIGKTKLIKFFEIFFENILTMMFFFDIFNSSSNGEEIEKKLNLRTKESKNSNFKINSMNFEERPGDVK